MVEILRKDFPAEGSELPAEVWFLKRITMDSVNVWIPKGGRAKGTLLIQKMTVDPGIHMPDFICNYLLNQVSQATLASFRNVATQVPNEESDNFWQSRLHADEQGLYAELAELASIRGHGAEVDCCHLPGAEVIQREDRLVDALACVFASTPDTSST